MAAKRGPIASAGSDREALEALRDRLAIEIDRTISVPYLVRLSSQFITAVAALKKLEPARVSRRVDEIAKRRARRQAAAGHAGTADS